MLQPPRYEYTGQRRLFFVMAAAALTVGVALMGVGAYGTLKDKGTAEQGVYIRPLNATPSPAVAGASEPPLGDQPFRLVIEKIGVDAPVAAFGVDEYAVPQVPYEGGLVAWYNFSAVPGTGGNAVFAGHYTWYGDAVFRHIGELQMGDKVVLRGENGVQLTYTVTANKLVDPSLDSARQWMASAEGDAITLITCGGTFTWTGDPIFGGEYDQRQVVRAEFAGRVVTNAAPGAAGG